MRYKKNKSLFFDVMKNGQKFVIFNMILGSFFVEKWETLEVTWS